MKAIILARESEEDQNSNDAQILRVSDYVKFKNLEPWKTFEIKESSTQGEREKFQEIIEIIKRSNETIALVADTVDRVQRSFKESVILDELRKAGKIEIHFYRENLIINRDSNSSDLIRWDVAVMFARSYVLQLSDNVKRKQEGMVRSGVYPGKPPYGYKNIKNADNKSEIIVDEAKALHVQYAFEQYATGAYSVGLLSRKINEQFNTKWTNSFTYKVLIDQFYIGFMSWKKQLHPHRYKQFITQDLFDKVQSVRVSFGKKKFKYAGKPYLYRGLLRCAICDLSITPEKQKGIVYYHCTEYREKHHLPWATEASVTEQIGNIFKNMQLPKIHVDQIVESLQNVHEGKIKFREEQFKQLADEHEKYSKRIERLQIDRYDGRITDDDYDKFYQSFHNDLVDIDVRMKMLQDAEDNYYCTAKLVLDMTNRAHELFVSSKVEERRQLIKFTLQNLKLHGKKVEYEAVEPFNTIIKYADQQLWYPREDSNL